MLFFGLYIFLIIYCLIRRRMVGGELGGTRKVSKFVSGFLVIGAWMVFVIGSGMQFI